jgi:hypothetical protein
MPISKQMLNLLFCSCSIGATNVGGYGKELEVPFHLSSRAPAYMGFLMFVPMPLLLGQLTKEHSSVIYLYQIAHLLVKSDFHFFGKLGRFFETVVALRSK